MLKNDLPFITSSIDPIQLMTLAELNHRLKFVIQIAYRLLKDTQFHFESVHLLQSYQSMFQQIKTFQFY